MTSIRNAARGGATAGLVGAGIGAIGGAALAAYGGGDIKEGAIAGAIGGGVGGLGLNLRNRFGILPGLAEANRMGRRADRIASVRPGGLRGLFSSRARRLGGMEKDFRRASQIGRNRTISRLGKRYRAGAIAGGAMGTAIGGGYAMLPSNRGLGVTSANATLDQKLAYQQELMDMRYQYSAQETMMKKQVWGGY